MRILLMIMNKIVFGIGWHYLEYDEDKKEHFIWCSDESWIHLWDKTITAMEFTFIKPSFIQTNKLIIKLDNGNNLTYKIAEGENKIKFFCDGVNTIKIFSDSFIPDSHHKNYDMRTLGLNFRHISIHTNNGIEHLDLRQQTHQSPVDLETKSIEEQNPTAQLLNFPYKEKEYYFNSCIFEKNNEKYIMVRKSTDISDTEECYVNFNSELVLYKISDDYKILYSIELNIIPEIENEQFEDPRVLIYNNFVLISCTSFNKHEKKASHQKIIVLDENFKHIKNIHPVYDGNTKTISENVKYHKNWTWFSLNSKLYAIIKFNPYTIVEFDMDGNALNEYINSSFDFEWDYGVPRGGTNPILLNNKFYSFFHSHLKHGEDSRIYYMGRFEFEAKPPFKVLSISETPVLSGNLKNPMVLKSLRHKVVFPCGNIIDNDSFVVSLGINDYCSYVVKDKI